MADRADEALPPDRLEIEFVFDLARGADYRRAEVRALGALAARYARARAIEGLLQRAGWAEARRAILQGDASARAYERLTATTAPPRS